MRTSLLLDYEWEHSRYPRSTQPSFTSALAAPGFNNADGHYSGVIVGSILGGTVLVAVLIYVFLTWRRKRIDDSAVADGHVPEEKDLEKSEPLSFVAHFSVRTRRSNFTPSSPDGTHVNSKPNPDLSSTTLHESSSVEEESWFKSISATRDPFRRSLPSLIPLPTVPLATMPASGRSRIESLKRLGARGIMALKTTRLNRSKESQSTGPVQCIQEIDEPQREPEVVLRAVPGRVRLPGDDDYYVDTTKSWALMWILAQKFHEQHGVYDDFGCSATSKPAMDDSYVGRGR